MITNTVIELNTPFRQRTCNFRKASCTYLWFYLEKSLYVVSQEEWTKLRESVPYVELYRYNPKHLYPKLNGYGDNGRRKVWTSCIPAYCTSTAVVHWPWQCNKSSHLCDCPRSAQRDKTVDTSLLPDIHAQSKVLGNPKDKYDSSASVFVFQFNGFMSLTSYFDVKYRY